MFWPPQQMHTLHYRLHKKGVFSHWFYAICSLPLPFMSQHHSAGNLPAKSGLSPSLDEWELMAFLLEFDLPVIEQSVPLRLRISSRTASVLENICQ